MSFRVMRNFHSVAVAAVLVCAAAPGWAGDTYSVDGSHTFVSFRVNHLEIAESYGRFNESSGSFEVEEGALTSLTFEINTESVDTASEDRDKHLKGPDFFNTKQFPVIQFKSESIKKHGDHFEVAGELMMLGAKKPLTIEVRKTGEGKDPWGNFRTGWHSSFAIERSDFGMNFMLDGLGDQIAIVVSVEGIKQ